MKTKSLFTLASAALVLFASQSSLADEFSVSTGSRPISLGLGVLYKDKPYRGYDSSAKTNPVPVIL